MIPKKIHYCWFGRGEKSKLTKKCIESWKKFCPDYEIIEWNEDNVDVNLINYTKFAYENKLYAYLSDYVRLWAVYNHGGIYMDTDVELIKAPDELLKLNAYYGFEGDEFINTGVGFGAEQGHQSVKFMLKKYEDRSNSEYMDDYRNNHKMTGSPRMNTYALTSFGLKQNGTRQNVCGAEIFPKEYFCPFDDVTGDMNITENTFSIHWYSKSAQGKFAYYKSKISRPIHKILRNFK